MQTLLTQQQKKPMHQCQCGKTYRNTAALYRHIKQKHADGYGEGEDGSGGGRAFRGVCGDGKGKGKRKGKGVRRVEGAVSGNWGEDGGDGDGGDGDGDWKGVKGVEGRDWDSDGREGRKSNKHQATYLEDFMKIFQLKPDIVHDQQFYYQYLNQFQSFKNLQNFLDNPSQSPTQSPTLATILSIFLQSLSQPDHHHNYHCSNTLLAQILVALIAMLEYVSGLYPGRDLLAECSVGVVIGCVKDYIHNQLPTQALPNSRPEFKFWVMRRENFSRVFRGFQGWLRWRCWD